MERRAQKVAPKTLYPREATAHLHFVLVAKGTYVFVFPWSHCVVVFSGAHLVILM
jgi:hypothetical protein